MTEEEYMAKHDEYIRKSEYYRKKALDLEAKYFDELNKDNKFLKSLRKSHADKSL